jgi:hypothetical protein
VTWGSAGESTPVVGDWDGDGACTAGFYNPSMGRFYLDNDNNFAGKSDISLVFGPQETGYIPLVGDWNGDGTHTVGL